MKPSALLTTFVGLAFALLAATSASAAVSVIDTSAPHYRANPIVLSVSATADPAWNYVEEITDARGGLYTRGADGIYSFRMNAYSPALGIYSANEEVLAAGGSHPQSVSSVSVAYVNALAPGSWNLYLEVASFGWVDGHWESRGYYDEEGNWVEEDDEWRPPESGGAGAFQTWLPLTISNGGSIPQTITWTSSPPSILPFTQTTPITLAATCTTGAPVRFSLGPTSGYPYAFALAGNTLTYSGMVGTSGWIGNAWTVLAEAPASATHAYASTLYSITLDRGTQIMPTPITGPTISNTGSQWLWSLMAPAVTAAGGSSGIDYQLIGGGGTITAGTYSPNGYVGPVSIRTRYLGNDLFYPSNDGVITFATAVPTVVPAITSHPASTSAWVGGTINLAVAASGAPTPTYQWRKNGADLAGATAATLILANAQVADSGSYVAVATNSVGTAQSSPATVTISNPPPTIATQPMSRLTYAGESVALFATGAGSPTPSYQWRKDGVAIAGATSATLAFANPQATDAGSYTLVVSNPHGSVTSQPAMLTVQPARPPAMAATETVTGMVNTTFTHNLSAIPAAEKYSWTGGSIPGVTYFNGTSLLQGTPTQAGTFALSFKPWNMTGGWGTTDGTIIVVISPNPSIPSAPFIDTHPVSQTVNPGVEVIFSVFASGTGSLSYQWYRDGLPLAFQRMSSLLLGNVGPGDVGNYSVRVSNAVGSVTANVASLTVGGVAPATPPSNGSLPVITSQPQSAAVPAGQNATFGVIATSATPLAYQWLRNGSVIDGATLDSLSLIQVGYAGNGLRYSVMVSNDAGSIVSAEAELLVTGPVLAVSHLTSDSFRLSWTSETHAGNGVSYRVTIPGVLDNVPATQPFDVGNLSPATTYRVDVQASDYTGAVFRSVPLRITTPAASGVAPLAAKNAARSVQRAAFATSQPNIRTLTTAASPPAAFPSQWLNVWAWKKPDRTWIKTSDGILDEIMELNDPGRNSVLRVTGVTHTYTYTMLGTPYFSPFTLFWELDPPDFFGTSSFSDISDPYGNYAGPVGLDEQSASSVYFVHVETNYTGDAEFELEAGYDYGVYSMTNGNDANDPSKWSFEGLPTQIAGTTRGRLELPDIRPPTEKWYRLVRYGKPTGSIRVSDSTGGLLGGATVNGLLNVSLPQNGILSFNASDVLGRPLRSGENVSWKIGDANGNVILELGTDENVSWPNVIAGIYQIIFSRATAAPVKATIVVRSIITETQATSPANRARRKIGVGEEVILTLKTPIEETSEEITWRVASGGGRIDPPTGATTNYYAPSRAPTGAGSQPIIEAIQGSSTTPFVFLVVEPTGVYIEQQPGTNIRHLNGSASVGFWGDIYLLPSDVSFVNVNFSESVVAGIGLEYFEPDHEKAHKPNPLSDDPFSWSDVTATVSGKGAKVRSRDGVWVQRNRLPYTSGSFTWTIPLWFQVTTATLAGENSDTIGKQFGTVSQKFMIDVNGRMTVIKGTVDISANLGDATYEPGSAPP